MSVTSDFKNYVDQTVANAQAQLNDIAGTANDAVNDLRVSAEKAINLDAIKTAVEPYLAQVREYGTAVTDRAEDLLNGVKDDPRLAKFVEAANSVSSVVLEQVTEYVVKPVQSFTGFGAPQTRTAAQPAKPATTKPATKPATTASSDGGATGRPAAAKSTPRKTVAKTTSAARRSTTTSAPAAKPATRKSTARKSTSA